MERTTQRTINFNRATRLKWLELLPLRTRRPLKPLLYALESFLGDNATCWPSVIRLAQIVGTSERTAQRALGELEQLGLVMRSVRRVAGRQSTTEYRLNWSLICDLASSDSGVTLSGVTVAKRGVTTAPLRGDKIAIEGCQTDTLTNHKNQPKKHHPSANCSERPNRSPGTDGTNGVFESGKGRNDERAGQCLSATAVVFGRPLRIEPAELDSADRVDELWRLAVATGASHNNEAGRLRFFALCCYCRRNPNLKNPGAVLAENVRRGNWFGSDDDEARARRAMARLDARRGLTTPLAPPPELFGMPADALAAVVAEP